MLYGLFIRKIIIAIIIGIVTVSAQADDEDVLNKALKKLIIHGVTYDIKEAAQNYSLEKGYDCVLSVDECEKLQTTASLEPPINREEEAKEAKNGLIEVAKHAPEPYKTGAFKCVKDYEECNSHRKTNTKLCDTTLIVCFADEIVESFTPIKLK